MNRKSIEFTRAETDAVLRTDLMTFIHRVFCELYPSQALAAVQAALTGVP